jgi:D-galactonate transporter
LISNPANVSSATAVTSASEDHIYAKVTKRIVPFLCLCYVFSYLDRINVSFAKLQMSSELKFSGTVYGLGAGVFFIAYFLFEIPSNLLMVKVGARRWIARIMISWAVLTGVMAFTNSVTMFYVVRFLIGASEAGFFPAIILYLASWYPSSRRSKIIALFMSAIPISGVLGGLVSGWIIQTFDQVLGLGGWRWLFIVESIPSALMGVAALLYLDDGISQARWLAPAEKALVIANIEREGHTKTHSSVSGVFRSGRVWLLALVFFFVCMGQFTFGFWLPSIIKATGVKSLLDVGLLSAIPYAFGIVTMITVGRHSDKTGERRWHYALGAFFCCAGLVSSALWGSTSTVFAVTALTLGCMGLQSLPAIFWTFPTAMLGGMAAAAGIALVNSVGNLAGFVTPYMIGWLVDNTGSTSVGLYVTGGCIAVSGLVVLAIGGKRTTHS